VATDPTAQQESDKDQAQRGQEAAEAGAKAIRETHVIKKGWAQAVGAGRESVLGGRRFSSS
jgi:hypothetical protein